MLHRLSAILAETARRYRAKESDDWESKVQQLIADCHPKQRAFVLDPGRRVAALVARGGGKTTGARAKYVRTMLQTPGARCLYIALTGDQAEELMWAPLKTLCEKLDIAASFNETKRRCVFTRTGSTLRLVGADNKKEIEKLRGIPFHLVGVDESASYPTQLLEHLLFRIIGPRLGDFDGKLFLIGTPGHLLRGPFYDATRPGSEIHRKWEDRDDPELQGFKGWSFHSWTLRDGAQSVPAMQRLWAEALLEKETNQWTDDNPTWLREYLGHWAADDSEAVFKYRSHDDAGAPLNQWDPAKNHMGWAKLPSEFNDYQYSYGMDMGHSDPFALQVFAYSPSDPKKRLWHCFEFSKAEHSAPRLIAELLLGPDLDHEAPEGVFGNSDWPESIVADAAGMGGAILDELANVYGIKVKPAEKKNKFDAIELFNGDLVDERIFIMKGSKLEEQLQGLQWRVDDFGRLKEDQAMRNDCTDAAIYARREAQHLFSRTPEPAPAYLPPRKELHDYEVPSAAELSEFGDLLDDDNFSEFWDD